MGAGAAEGGGAAVPVWSAFTHTTVYMGTDRQQGMVRRKVGGLAD